MILLNFATWVASDEWQELPLEHCGEDVLVQLRIMALYGGCGLIPSGVYHQELPTTIVERSVAANNMFTW